MTSRLLIRPLLFAALLAVSACVYRLPIQQGNLLDPMQVEQLEEGMTRSQVAYLLGTPMVPSGFNNDRWDYLYYVKARGLEKPLKRRLTVWFEDEKVVRFERENMDLPPKAPGAQASAANPAADAAATAAEPATPPATDPTLAPSAESAIPASDSAASGAPDKSVDK